MLVTRTSVLSGVTRTLDLPVTPEQMEEFSRPREERRLVQEIFPGLTYDDREFLMLGITPDEWAQLPNEG